jgi:hypothetical protein
MLKRKKERKRYRFEAGGLTPVVECLLSKLKALSSNPHISKTGHDSALL